MGPMTRFRFSLRSLLIGVLVLAIGAAAVRQWGRVETHCMKSLSPRLPYPHAFYTQSPEELQEFEQELEAWFAQRGYERCDLRNFKHRYIFSRPDHPERRIVVKLYRLAKSGDFPGWNIDLWENVRQWRGQRIEPLRATKEELHLAQELVEWLLASFDAAACSAAPSPSDGDREAGDDAAAARMPGR